MRTAQEVEANQVHFMASNTARHNMWAFRDVRNQRAWLMCCDCAYEREVSEGALESFLERLPKMRDVHFMGMVVYHGR